ncbi:hypothetical protein ARMSODRAFT_972126 [Armillaria solidipes]|uniref:CCHC-type domain-containing protein n=1 Tax=Armillaria solidipes TaxID=1076256 RepID=A0A2H3BSD1_9AGAR|nr:hypothetical protein ARMSODRAFT_972126 [Armillaria solidipes]
MSMETTELTKDLVIALYQKGMLDRKANYRMNLELDHNMMMMVAASRVFKTHFKKKQPFGKVNSGHRHASGSQPEKYTGNSPPKDSCPKWKELSEQEKACFKSEGLCYHCGKSSHMAHQCPEGKNVPSERKNNPPRFSTSNVNFENLHGLADTTEDLHELKVGMMQYLYDDLISEEEYSEDDCPDLQTVIASMWPYCDDDVFLFREGEDDSSEWETVVSASVVTSESSRYELHECIRCHSLELCDKMPDDGSENIWTQIPYQVLFNVMWDSLDVDSFGINVAGVHEMLLDSVICYLIEMDGGETSPPDPYIKNEDLTEILDYLVAETTLYLDPTALGVSKPGSSKGPVVLYFEEKFLFIHSYGHKENCHPCSFRDTVAQNAVERYSDMHHLIMDKHYLGTHLPYETLIWMDWLETENFPLAMWYAQERSVIPGIPLMDWPPQSHWISGEKMRPPFKSEVITYLRNHWFPGDHEFDPSGWQESEEGRFRIIDYCDTPDNWPHGRCKPPDYGDEWVILKDRHHK